MKTLRLSVSTRLFVVILFTTVIISLLHAEQVPVSVVYNSFNSMRDNWVATELVSSVTNTGRNNTAALEGETFTKAANCGSFTATDGSTSDCKFWWMQSTNGSYSNNATDINQQTWFTINSNYDIVDGQMNITQLNGDSWDYQYATGRSFSWLSLSYSYTYETRSNNIQASIPNQVQIYNGTNRATNIPAGNTTMAYNNAPLPQEIFYGSSPQNQMMVGVLYNTNYTHNAGAQTGWNKTHTQSEAVRIGSNWMQLTFVLPEVREADHLSCDDADYNITMNCEPGAPVSHDFTFAVYDAKNINQFEIVGGGNGFSAEILSYAAGAGNNGTLTVRVTYDAVTGFTSNSDVCSPEFTLRIKGDRVRSYVSTDKRDCQFKTWVRCMSDDVTPEFTLSPTSLSFSNQHVGNTSEELSFTYNPGRYSTAPKADALSFDNTHFTLVRDEVTGTNANGIEIHRYTFTFTPLAAGNLSTTATLRIYNQFDSKYTEHSVTLTGTGVAVTEGKLFIEGEEEYMFTPNPRLNVGETQTLTFRVSGIGVDMSSWVWKSQTGDNTIIAYSIGSEPNTFQLTLTPTEVRTYSTTLTIATTAITGSNEGEEVTAELHLTLVCPFESFIVNPTASGGPNTYSLTLDWDKVENAVKYEIIYDANDNDIADDAVLRIITDDLEHYTATNVHTELQEGSYRFFVRATDAYGKTLTQPCVCTIGNIITTDNCDAVGLAALGIQGITEGVCSTFNSSGKCLFNTLYIFEETASTHWCYVYTGTPGTGTQYNYSASESFDPYTACKSIAGNGKKIYITGKCTRAFTGGTDNDTEGLFTLTGSGIVNIYLDNFTAYTINRTGDENMLVDLTCSGVLNCLTKAGQATRLLTNGVRVNANSCVFAIKTSNNSTVSFHIRGESELKANLGKHFTINVDVAGTLTANVGGHCASAPIAILNNNAVTLSFDDTWADGNYTNGALNLPSYFSGSSQAPSIDVGSANSVCEFYGGQYKLITTYASSSNYSCSLSITYRSVERSSVTLYGFANDNADACVRIFGGTFSTYPGPDVGVTNGIYASKYDLRLPVGSPNKKSYIDGGTFNLRNQVGSEVQEGRVYLCSSITSKGSSPVNSSDKILCQSHYEPSSTNADGSVEFSIPLEDPFNKYYSAYGKHGLNVDAWNLVHVYLPRPADATDDFCPIITEEVTYNWQTIIPKMEVSLFGISRSLGGDKTIKTTPIHNRFFGYIELDENIANVETIEGDDNGFNYGDIIGGRLRANANNTTSYDVEDAIYMALFVNSNEWFNLCPPFDVHEVFVLETAQRNSIGTANPTGEINASNLTAAYLQANPDYMERFLKNQAERNAQMSYDLVFKILPDGQDTGQPNDLETLLRSVSFCRAIIPLTAFDGENWATANYYAYRLDNEEGLWDKHPGETNFRDCWLMGPANITKSYTRPNSSTQSYNVLYEKGKNYDLYFPSNTKVNYWDGKFIIFKGYGKQTIAGSGEQSSFARVADIADMGALYDFDDARAWFGGNYTFKSYSTSGTTYTADNGSEYIRHSGSQNIYPGRGYLVIDGSAARNIVAVGRRGAITYSHTSTGIPHLSDNIFTAYPLEGAIAIEAQQEQQVTVYSASGQLIWQGLVNAGGKEEITVVPGMYIVQGEKETKKLIVR